MNSNIRTCTLLAFVLASSWYVVWGDEPQAGQELTVSTVEKVNPEMPDGDAKRVPSRRLPRYFASIVDSRQREAIYKIQAAVREKLELLEQQLEELREFERQEIDKILTASQRQQIAELRSRAANRPSSVTEADARQPSSAHTGQESAPASGRASLPSQATDQ